VFLGVNHTYVANESPFRLGNIDMKDSTEKFSCKSDFFYARLNIAQHEDSLIDL